MKLIYCKNKKCGKKIKYGNKKDHLKVCRYEELICNYCKYKGLRKNHKIYNCYKILQEIIKEKVDEENNNNIELIMIRKQNKELITKYKKHENEIFNYKNILNVNNSDILNYKKEIIDIKEDIKKIKNKKNILTKEKYFYIIILILNLILIIIYNYLFYIYNIKNTFLILYIPYILLFFYILYLFYIKYINRIKIYENNKKIINIIVLIGFLQVIKFVIIEKIYS